MAVSRRLRVDPVACDGFGHCAELAPELIGLDEWGYPVIAAHAAVPREILDVVELAVRSCPRKALFLEPVEMAAPRRRSPQGAGRADASAR
jgi:ferredoxin